MIIHGSISRAVDALDGAGIWSWPRPRWPGITIDVTRDDDGSIPQVRVLRFDTRWAEFVGGELWRGDFPDWAFRDNAFAAPEGGVITELRTLSGFSDTVGAPLIGKAQIDIAEILAFDGSRRDAIVQTAFGDGFLFRGTDGADVNAAARPKPDGTPRLGDDFRGDDVVRLRAGDDIWFGGGGADRIFAGAGDDQVWGGPGRDLIRGGAGADRILGGLHADRISGGDGDDVLHGEAGDDVIRGGAGADALWGGDGADDLRGQGGRDRIHGDAGADLIFAGGGRDQVFGGGGADRMFGGAGDDSLYGGPGDDRIFGGRGDDLIEAGPGRDYLAGGQGADRFLFRKGHDFAEIADLFPGDLLVLRGFPELSRFSDIADRIRDTPQGAVLEIGDDWLLIRGRSRADLGPDAFDF